MLQELTDKEGNKTGHLVGLFNRTIQFISNGIKPVWVFDGKPPAMKSGELARRKRLKQEAVEETEKALEQGDMQKALQFNQRTTHITTKMKDDAIKMLRLMGCPVIMAPSEAEAQCAALCKAGKIYATATEDLDALTFKTPVLLRGFNTKNEPIYEIIFDDMLVELDLTYEQFVDLCILVSSRAISLVRVRLHQPNRGDRSRHSLQADQGAQVHREDHRVHGEGEREPGGEGRAAEVQDSEGLRVRGVQETLHHAGGGFA